MDVNELKQKIVELHREYGLDRTEFGKILVIASASMLVVSVHAALTLQSVGEQVEKSNNQMEKVSAIVNSQNFQQAVDQLQQIRSERISSQLNLALNSFEKIQSSVEQSKQVEKRLDREVKNYQWVSLLGIVGIVAGIAAIYS